MSDDTIFSRKEQLEKQLEMAECEVGKISEDIDVLEVRIRTLYKINKTMRAKVKRLRKELG